MNSRICLLALAVLLAAIVIAVLVSCDAPGPITINNTGGQGAPQISPPQSAEQAPQPDPVKPFNYVRFWSIVGAGLLTGLLILIATGNLHPFKPFRIWGRE